MADGPPLHLWWFCASKICSPPGGHCLCFFSPAVPCSWRGPCSVPDRPMRRAEKCFPPPPFAGFPILCPPPTLGGLLPVPLFPAVDAKKPDKVGVGPCLTELGGSSVPFPRHGGTAPPEAPPEKIPPRRERRPAQWSKAPAGEPRALRERDNPKGWQDNSEV